MSGRVDGKVMLVTGVASGIGRATAIALAREGARLVLGDIAAAGEDTAHAARTLGADAQFLQCDVARQPDVDELVARACRVMAGSMAPSTTPGSRARCARRQSTPRRRSCA